MKFCSTTVRLVVGAAAAMIMTATASAGSAGEAPTCIPQTLSTTGSSSDSNSDSSVCIRPPLYQPTCGLYMAPSTLGEGANLGMYAGHDIPANTVIQQEIALPLLFRDWEGPSYFHQYPGVTSGDHDDGALWYRYIWSGWVANLETYQITNTQKSKVVFVPGIGCTINSILEMRNVYSTHGSIYDTAGLSRGDPSAGAFCPYHSSDTTSVAPIPAGGEIFADYGDEWIPDIPGAQITFDVVMDAAEDFLRDEYIPFVQRATKKNKKLPERVLEGLWNFTRDLPHPNPKTFTVLPRAVTWKDIYQQYETFTKVEAPVLKAQAQQAQAAAQDPTTDAPIKPYYTELSSLVRHFIRQQGKRSLDWLAEHGRCCDHMRPDISTIPHAGRGAFATRDLPKGTIVGYSPLVHVGTYGKDLYNVPYVMGPQGEKSYDKSDLILNYAFGHANSTVLLSPYGSMVNYINHAPSPSRSAATTDQQQEQPQANVRIVWPEQEMMAHKPDWLTKDVDFLTFTLEKIGLSFDYVALRDIAEGEEIFLDYGPEWEEAWEQHLANWEAPPDAETYVHSSAWEEEHFRTQDELVSNPYPPNLQTICLPSYMWNAAKEAYYYVALERDYIDRVPCTVIERRDHPSDPEHNPEVYTVQMLSPFTANGDGDERQPITVLAFPREAIFLTDRVMSQDWHLKNTFRHPIMVPDDIFPESWKNLPLKENDGYKDEEDGDTDGEEEDAVTAEE